MRSIVVGLGLCLLMAVSSASALDLVKGSKAAGEFVVSKDAHRAILFSVTDIRQWIHEITDVNVPILNDPSAQDNTKVFVGQEFAGEWAKDLAALKGSDGYAIRTKGKSVYVFGDRPRGTLYGVFALLEENSDIIWARPNRRFGTVFGESKDLVLSKIDFLNKPVFPVRHQGGHFRPYHQDTLDWQIRNLANVTLGPNIYLDMVVGHGDIPYWILSRTAGARWIETNPEIFSYVEDLKRRDSRGVCYMNPELDEIYFKELMRNVEAKEKQLGRKIDHINSHMGDSWQCCDCPLCLAPIKLADGTELKPRNSGDQVFRSTQYYMFYSRITERLKKVRPDLKLVVLAYIYSAAAPKVKPHPDLQIIFAPYPTSNMHFAMLDERQPAMWRNRYKEWLTLTKRLGMREYYNASTIALMSLTCAQDLKTLMATQDTQNVHIATETRDDVGAGSEGWDLAAMELWIINRLFWDPTQDMEQLRARFIQRTYREAAPAMTRYYDILRKSWLDPDDRTMAGYHIGQAYMYENLVAKKGLEPQVLQALEDALKTVKHPNSREMIERLYTKLRSANQDLGKLMVANIPEMFQDGGSFESVQWEKPLELTDFKRPYLYGQPNDPSVETEVRAGHDGKNLYVRFKASDPRAAEIEAIAPGATETFPLGDHIEFWLSDGNTKYLFAFNANGAKYDSKDLDRTWNTEWRLATRKTDSGWDAMITLPLSAFKLVPKQATSLRWTALREIQHKGEPSEVSLFEGMSLHYKTFEIVVE